MKEDIIITELKTIRQEMADMKVTLKQDIDNVRAELKQDIDDVRAELKQDINNVRAELKQDITDAKDEMFQYIDQKLLETRADIAKDNAIAMKAVLNVVEALPKLLNQTKKEVNESVMIDVNSNTKRIERIEQHLGLEAV